MGGGRAVLGKVDGEWATHRVTSGLSTGEGLIWHVRDPQEADGRGSGDEDGRNGRKERTRMTRALRISG